MTGSLRLRLMFGAAVMAVVFTLALQQGLQRGFGVAFEHAIEQRLASDVSTLVSAARVENGTLAMPERLHAEQFDILESNKLLGYIYDRDGQLLWRSAATNELRLDYQPFYETGQGYELHRIQDENGVPLFVYDAEIRLLGGADVAYSIVVMQPARDYDLMLSGLRQQHYLWLGAALLGLLLLLWVGLSWGLMSLRSVSLELDEVEAGERQRLSEAHPRELLRLTRSVNRLLDSEQQQRARYRHSLADLAHGLKTPLSLLQATSDVIARDLGRREQVRVMDEQIDRMNQQIEYQLQRAAVRRSGLVRHRAAVKPVLAQLKATLDKVYHEKQVQLTSEVSAGLALPLEPGALLELLGNLLENAYRLCVFHIRVQAEATAAGWRLVVEDDGPGVPPGKLAVIVQRGERLDTRHPGQGLGLAIVKDILESYDGHLSVTTSELGGARFEVLLLA